MGTVVNGVIVDDSNIKDMYNSYLSQRSAYASASDEKVRKLKRL